MRLKGLVENGLRPEPRRAVLRVARRGQDVRVWIQREDLVENFARGVVGLR